MNPLIKGKKIHVRELMVEKKTEKTFPVSDYKTNKKHTKRMTTGSCLLLRLTLLHTGSLIRPGKEPGSKMNSR